ncbi:MAG: hypothetical protein E7464_07235 [Ruminococcaceae bacterium]|nr:hypothetical protein [Oscillospiraceae bacterium]
MRTAGDGCPYSENCRFLHSRSFLVGTGLRTVRQEILHLY